MSKKLALTRSQRKGDPSTNLAAMLPYTRPRPSRAKGKKRVSRKSDSSKRVDETVIEEGKKGAVRSLNPERGEGEEEKEAQDEKEEERKTGSDNNDKYLRAASENKGIKKNSKKEPPKKTSTKKRGLERMSKEEDDLSNTPAKKKARKRKDALVPVEQGALDTDVGKRGNDKTGNRHDSGGKDWEDSTNADEGNHEISSGTGGYTPTSIDKVGEKEGGKKGGKAKMKSTALRNEPTKAKANLKKPEKSAVPKTAKSKSEREKKDLIPEVGDGGNVGEDGNPESAGIKKVGSKIVISAESTEPEDAAKRHPNRVLGGQKTVRGSAQTPPIPIKPIQDTDKVSEKLPGPNKVPGQRNNVSDNKTSKNSPRKKLPESLSESVSKEVPEYVPGYGEEAPAMTLDAIKITPPDCKPMEPAKALARTAGPAVDDEASEPTPEPFSDDEERRRRRKRTSKGEVPKRNTKNKIDIDDERHLRAIFGDSTKDKGGKHKGGKHKGSKHKGSKDKGSKDKGSGGKYKGSKYKGGEREGNEKVGGGDKLLFADIGGWEEPKKTPEPILVSEEEPKRAERPTTAPKKGTPIDIDDDALFEAIFKDKEDDKRADRPTVTPKKGAPIDIDDDALLEAIFQDKEVDKRVPIETTGTALQPGKEALFEIGDGAGVANEALGTTLPEKPLTPKEIQGNFKNRPAPTELEGTFQGLNAQTGYYIRINPSLGLDSVRNKLRKAYEKSGLRQLVEENKKTNIIWYRFKHENQLKESSMQDDDDFKELCKNVARSGAKEVIIRLWTSEDELSEDEQSGIREAPEQETYELFSESETDKTQKKAREEIPEGLLEPGTHSGGDAAGGIQNLGADRDGGYDGGDSGDNGDDNGDDNDDSYDDNDDDDDYEGSDSDESSSPAPRKKRAGQDSEIRQDDPKTPANGKRKANEYLDGKPQKKRPKSYVGRVLEVLITPRKATQKVYSSAELAQLKRRKKWAQWKPGTAMEHLQVKDHLIQDITDELLRYEDEAVMAVRKIKEMEAIIAQKTTEIQEQETRKQEYRTAYTNIRMRKRSAGCQLYLADAIFLDDIESLYKDVLDMVLGYTTTQFSYPEYFRTDIGRLIKSYVGESDRSLVERFQEYVRNLRERENKPDYGRHFLQYIKRCLIQDDTLPASVHNRFFSDPHNVSYVVTALIMQVLQKELFDKMWDVLQLDKLSDSFPNATENLPLTIQRDFIRDINWADVDNDDERETQNSDYYQYNCHRARMMSHLVHFHPKWFETVTRYTDYVGVVILNTIAPLLQVTEGIDPTFRPQNLYRLHQSRSDDDPPDSEPPFTMVDDILHPGSFKEAFQDNLGRAMKAAVWYRIDRSLVHLDFRFRPQIELKKATKNDELLAELDKSILIGEDKKFGVLLLRPEVTRYIPNQLEEEKAQWEMLLSSVFLLGGFNGTALYIPSNVDGAGFQHDTYLEPVLPRPEDIAGLAKIDDATSMAEEP